MGGSVCSRSDECYYSVYECVRDGCDYMKKECEEKFCSFCKTRDGDVVE